ncbi:hypothetical protein PHYPSEUDO_006919 [Phytophthora pseudosyringae]|uniref:Ubiquitin-like protease family profile domain-containing protein n=1 Tax=Phytophthora pseudosyringae TaxID=221518 RepID=A0A8T1VKJ1_9STRA|nr:hypothetical protein PHYPSEUDO_006919 [Phytophthora pseudosyringae]
MNLQLEAELELVKAERDAMKLELQDTNIEKQELALKLDSVDKVNCGAGFPALATRTLAERRGKYYMNIGLQLINFYFHMMNDRDASLVEVGTLPQRSYFFSTYFYLKMMINGAYSFTAISKFTVKVNLFAMNKIFVPVHVRTCMKNHWSLTVVFVTEHRTQYYDSMEGSGMPCLKMLLRYLRDELQDKKGELLIDTDWELVDTTTNTPQQDNCHDCGVFTCLYAECLSLNKSLSFSQQDIPFNRNRMALQIISS